MPAAVLCTSGTAVANLLPATMEAFHSGVPLLLLTADRPPELRGVGANQATVQPGMFAAWVREQIDAPVPGDGCPRRLDRARRAVRSPSRWARTPTRGLPGVAGPVHLNLPSREPLSGGTAAAVPPGEAPRPGSRA